MAPRARRYLTEIALTVGAIAGLLCVVAAIVGVSFGLSPLVFRTGSMAPTIGVGDVAIARSVPAADVAVGDIVSVTRPDGERITHRVASIDARVGNSTTMTLLGDANNVADAAPYTVTSVGRVVFDIPTLGYVLGVFANPYAWVLATLATLGLLWIAFVPHRPTPRHRPRHAAPVATSVRNRTLALQSIAALLVVAAAVTGYTRTSGTLAALTDSATAAGTVSAIRPNVPASLSCANQSGNARLSWPNPTANQGYDYQLVFTPTFLGGAPTTTVVAASTADPASLLVSRTATGGALGLGLLGTYSVELRSKVGNFLSTGRITITMTVFLGSVSCGSSTGTSSQTAGAAAARQAAPTSSAASTSAAPQSTTSSTSTSAPTSAPSSSTASPSSSAPATATSTTAPVTPGVVSPDGASAAEANNGVVIIRDTATGAEQYRSDLSAESVQWVDSATLRVTSRSGTVTILRRDAGQWSAVTPVAPAAVSEAPTSAPVTAPAG